MKHKSNSNFLSHRKIIAFLLLLMFAVPCISTARPTSEAQAKRVARNWVAMDKKPLNIPMGTEVKDITTFYDDEADPTYHIVYMEPEGFIIVAGDDAVEPIIGFVTKGKFDPSLENPLGALVTQDVPSRVKFAREMEQQGSTKKGMDFLANGPTKEARNKWLQLDREQASAPVEFGVATISDVRVSPLLQTQWDQTTEWGFNQCYNLYTPKNYPCGCVATAFAQIMRFFKFPTTAVGTPLFSITVDGDYMTRRLRGGNGSGGVYNWDLMDTGPTVSLATHRAAIGALTHDAGVSVNMMYGPYGSGAYSEDIADAIKNTFHYSNAKKGYNYGDNIPATKRNDMVNTNLDAGYPVAFGIYGSGNGHAIVGDGYGYNIGTLYHHLNMGWSGSQNAWYNLPNVDDDFYGYTSVFSCVYNIYPSGSGEIISGRVTDSRGNPISGVAVTAARAGGSNYSTTTNAKGIYAFKKIPSASTYQIRASNKGYTFNSQSVSTSTSNDYYTVGNRWGINFASSTGPVIPPAISADLSGVYALLLEETTPWIAPPDPCVDDISIGMSKSGTWISSCQSTHRSGSYARFYTLSVPSATTVTLNLISTADTYMYLLDGENKNGSIITQDDDGGDGVNSRIIRSLTSGKYTIEATTYSGATTGNFTLTVQ